MRIAVVGLGAIAEKAYLPILTARADLELVFCTRDVTRLRALAAAYRVREAVTSVDAAIAGGLDAAFVHTATAAHPAVAEPLLRAGVPVYVDKPLAYTYDASARLVEAAERAGCLLLVGFNRRFAPLYRRVPAQGAGRVVLLQKHRPGLADYARRVVFDDYIHVVDTLRALAGAPLGAPRVAGGIRAGLLEHVVLQCEAPGVTAVGVMHRDTGATAESLEVLARGQTWVVRDLNALVQVEAGVERTFRFRDWETVLHRRGLPQIVEHFLACVRGEVAPAVPARDALETHALCERIVAALEDAGAAPWAPAEP